MSGRLTAYALNTDVNTNSECPELRAISFWSLRWCIYAVLYWVAAMMFWQWGYFKSGLSDRGPGTVHAGYSWFQPVPAITATDSPQDNEPVRKKNRTKHCAAVRERGMRGKKHEKQPCRHQGFHLIFSSCPVKKGGEREAGWASGSQPKLTHFAES